MPTPYSRFRPHPWHGLSPGPMPPAHVHAFIEITPFSTMKFEVDKVSGYLKVDRPQASASLPPTPYGFIPRTYCGARVAALAGTARGDGDPLDVVVLSERPLNQADVLLTVRVVGGLLMVDAGEADDKIIAVLDRDPVWAAARDLADVPPALVQRLRHYFTTYKLVPDEAHPVVTVQSAYGADRAHAVVRAALDDYTAEFGEALPAG